MKNKIDINIVTHEYRKVQQNMIVCPSCHYQQSKVPKRECCPQCGYNKLVVIEGEYKELQEKDINNYKEC
ncbi:hypothetical protein LCGC14_2937520 [marine sediment metagenome]|uniref:Uncharacterized protein n=1 Tax=marine sediment metagenome TaxID=412755 RepID=A0A0F9AA19_9ZZZZ